MKCRKREKISNNMHQSHEKLKLSAHLEVLHSLNSKLKCGIFVTNEESCWMQLKGTDSPHVINSFFDCFVQSKTFVRPSD